MVVLGGWRFLISEVRNSPPCRVDVGLRGRERDRERERGGETERDRQRKRETDR